MLQLRRQFSMALAAIAAFVSVAATAQQQPAAAPFTTQQAATGRTTYQASCSGCHVADLAGRNEAPQLAGSNFMATWGGRTTRDLVTFIQATMPPGNVRGLPEQEYLNLAAFILEANGALGGNAPLTAATNVVIGSVATGQVPASLRQATANQAPAAQQQPPAQATAPRGLTVTGEVKNYVPVTDQMLLNPDPADWLMIRRNYQASN